MLFEKALDEPKYSSMYAQLCKRLSVEAPILKQADNSSEFLNLLLNVCRDRFLNRQSVNHYNHGLSNLDAEDDEKLHIAKQKMLGNVKFIGELYKLDMLQDSTLHKCIQQLLLDKDRSNTIKDRCEDMECLSQLIRTCGKDLDSEEVISNIIFLIFLSDVCILCGSNNVFMYPSKTNYVDRSSIQL